MGCNPTKQRALSLSGRTFVLRRTRSIRQLPTRFVNSAKGTQRVPKHSETIPKSIRTLAAARVIQRRSLRCTLLRQHRARVDQHVAWLKFACKKGQKMLARESRKAQGRKGKRSKMFQCGNEYFMGPSCSQTSLAATVQSAEHQAPTPPIFRNAPKSHKMETPKMEPTTVDHDFARPC